MDSDREEGRQLREACETGDADEVRRLLALKAERDSHPAGEGNSNWFGRTSLMAAAQAGHAEVVKLLLHSEFALSAAINATNKSGWTALMYASINGHEGVARLLLQAGAATQLRESRGRSAAEMAKSPEMQRLFAEQANEHEHARFRTPTRLGAAQKATAAAGSGGGGGGQRGSWSDSEDEASSPGGIIQRLGPRISRGRGGSSSSGVTSLSRTASGRVGGRSGTGSSSLSYDEEKRKQEVEAQLRSRQNLLRVAKDELRKEMEEDVQVMKREHAAALLATNAELKALRMEVAAMQQLLVNAGLVQPSAAAAAAAGASANAGPAPPPQSSPRSSDDGDRE